MFFFQQRDDALETFTDHKSHRKHVRDRPSSNDPFEGLLVEQDRARHGVKLVEGAQKTWRRLDGQNMLPKLVANVKFKDGIEASSPQAKAAA